MAVKSITSEIARIVVITPSHRSAESIIEELLAFTDYIDAGLSGFGKPMI